VVGQKAYSHHVVGKVETEPALTSMIQEKNALEDLGLRPMMDRAKKSTLRTMERSSRKRQTESQIMPKN